MSAPGGLVARSPDLLRDDWSAHALSTEPADRPAAEAAVARIYAAVDRPPPEFVWVRSPAEATTVLPAAETFRFPGDPRSVEARIAGLLAELRRPLWRPARRRPGEWRPGEGGLSGDGGLAGHRLRRTVRDCLVPLVNSTMPWSPGLGWSGQHDADWLAGLDARGRLRGPLLESWAVLARSTGWWWPREGRCVLADRPTALHLDADSVPHNDNGPAVTFADGSGACAWHGRKVPRWAVEEPDVVRILTEPDHQVRLAAAERLGWDAYVARAGPPLLGTAPDPGNPGCALELYDLWGSLNLLMVTNGSVERDGTRRRYGLPVGRWYRDPLGAAAVTYGLEARQYAQLLRRT
ncbi:DUF6745 domain-containing protein [Lentzea sp. NPDC060358]|uniref:DUF6745 domain-containing protein n=1 Tax=Lentzea sp. NPDC060358 TaxID=3347103 RepID=UPI00364A6802